MRKTEKNTTLYPTPFSRAYWRDAAAELKDTRMLVFAAFMIALRVALKLVAIPLAPNLKINTAFFANALGAMVYGPVVAGFAAVVSDVLGVMLTGEPYFPPFALTEIAGSMIFALFLYRARVTPLRVMLSRFSICFFVNVLLQTPIMMLYYKVYMGGSSYVLTVPQILKNLYLFPIESVLLTMFLSMIQPVTYKMKLTFSPDTALKFNRKEIVTLVALFLLGSVCVTGYLFYHYDTTSLTTGYSTEERIEKNRAMDAYIDTETGGTNGVTVSIIGSAKKPFLSSTVTYEVAYYAVSIREENLVAGAVVGYDMDALWALKKTPASKHADLTLLGNARIVVNDKTGEVLEFSYVPVNCDH